MNRKYDRTAAERKTPKRKEMLYLCAEKAYNNSDIYVERMGLNIWFGEKKYGKREERLDIQKTCKRR